MTSDTPFQQLLRAIVRFWWVALLGIALAGVAFVYATYTVKLGMPPKLTARSQPTYSAQTQLLVTSKKDPTLSSSNVNSQIINLYPNDPTTGAPTTGGTTTPTQTRTYDSSGGADGDLQRLVEIANALPPIVTSDPVVHLRERTFRIISGTVSAVNTTAFSGAGGFREGSLPYIQITGNAATPQDALDITNQTAKAFILWFKARQVTAGIKVDKRVLVEQVNSADHATASGGVKPLLGGAAAILVLLGGAGLVLALDRLIPRRAPAPRRERIAVPAPHEELALPVVENEMPALEVPTMTLGASVEDAKPDSPKAKPARPRKGSSNGTPRRRRASATPPRVAPNTDDVG